MADTSRLLMEHEEVSEERGKDEDTESGMNVWQTALSIAGYSAGFSFLAIEVFVVSTGFVGVLTFFVVYAMMLYSSVLLGRCYNMVRQKVAMTRHPYGQIGQEAFGAPLRSFIHFLVAFVGFSGAIGLQLALAEMALVVGGPALRGTFCYWPLLFGLLLCPLAWLGSPKDFWWIAACSYFTVVLAVVFIFFALLLGGDSPAGLGAHDRPRESGLFHLTEMAGILIWTRGLHYAMPTVQRDMQQPQAFHRAIFLTDALILPVVLPLILALFLVYGQDTLSRATGNVTVLSLLREGALKRIAAVLILVHLVGPVLAANNPFFQYLEEVLEIPCHFTWKRALLRSGVMLLQVFVQESVPQVMIIGSVTGGVLALLLACVVPPLCFLRLRRDPGCRPPQRTGKEWILERLDTVGCWLLLAASPFIAASVIFVTSSQILMGMTVFSVPCYVNATLAHA